MKKRHIYLFLFLSSLIFPMSHLTAQDNKYKDIIKPEGIKNKKYIVTLSGLGDLEFLKPININLGMSVSAGLRILSKPKIKQGKSAYSPRIAERELYIKPTFGYIYRKRYNTAFFFVPEIAYRHTFYKGIFIEVNVDVGYMYTKMNAPVYERQDDGSFKKVSFGYNNIMAGGKVVAGYDFSKNLKTPIAIQFGPGVFYRYPSNQKWIRHIYVELGVSYVFRKIKE
ncbi:MAG: hypothetical protein JWN78_1705 [Bacteroidota bacterium]|nr:hypothetical protein [Bacteroidota bacterium]